MDNHLLIVACTAFLASSVKATAPLEARVHIQMSSAAYVTHPWYLSWGMDSNLIRNRWQTFDFHSEKLRTLARGLSPAFMRLMGTDGDHMIFDDTSDPSHSGTQGMPIFKERAMFPPTNFTFNTTDWDNINNFIADVGWRMLFGINGQMRDGQNWDPTNALKLLTYSIKKGYAYNMDFELGNEPDLWAGNPSFTDVSGQQLGKDFIFLRNLLDTELAAYFKRSFLVGPDVAGGGSPYLSQFLSTVGNSIRAVTFHHYYGGPELSNINNYTDPKILDSYKSDVTDVIKAIANSPNPHLRIWQGETSSTWGAPQGPWYGEDYVAGFMLLDKLGLSASMGIELVIRQTFFGFWFALVDADLQPRPNYWTCLLFKQLVGMKVLATSVEMSGNTPERFRIYSHCAKTDGVQDIPVGAVVAYAMNLNDVDVQFTFDQTLHNSSIQEYLLTPGDKHGLASAFIQLNGEVLQQIGDYSLPVLKPRQVSGPTVTLPAMSYAFYVLPDAKALVCY